MCKVLKSLENRAFHLKRQQQQFCAKRRFSEIIFDLICLKNIYKGNI